MSTQALQSAQVESGAGSAPKSKVWRRAGQFGAALAIAATAVYGATVMTAHAPQEWTPAAASGGLGIMQMMQDAQRLPVQQWDAI